MGLAAITAVAGKVWQSAGKSPVRQIGSERQHSAGVLTEAMNDENLGMNLSGSGGQAPVGYRVNAVFQMMLASAGSGFHR